MSAPRVTVLVRSVPVLAELAELYERLQRRHEEELAKLDPEVREIVERVSAKVEEAFLFGQ